MPVLPDDQGEKIMEVADERNIYIYIYIYIYICIKKRKRKFLFLFK
jgi:hypothetical protein